MIFNNSVFFFFFNRYETMALKEKLESLEKKILVGGENLLEKAEVQEHLLEASAKELDERVKLENELRNQIAEREVSTLYDFLLAIL